MTPDTITTEIAASIDEAVALWENGKATSPDARDYVRNAILVFQKHYPSFVEPMEAWQEQLADDIWEAECERSIDSQEIATMLYENLAAGIDPSAEHDAVLAAHEQERRRSG